MMDNSKMAYNMALSNRRYLDNNVSHSQYGHGTYPFQLYQRQTSQFLSHPSSPDYYSYSQNQTSQLNESASSHVPLTSPHGLLYDTMSIPARLDRRLQSTRRRTGRTGSAPSSAPGSKRQKLCNETRGESTTRRSPLLKSREAKLAVCGSQLDMGCGTEDNPSEVGSRVSECCSSCSEGLPCAEPDCEKQKDAVIPCTKQSCNEPVCAEPCLPECIKDQKPIWGQRTVPSSERISAWNSDPWNPQDPRASSPISIEDKVYPALLPTAESVPTNSGSPDPHTPSIAHHMETPLSPEQGLPTGQFAGNSSNFSEPNASAPIVSGTGAMFDTAGWAGSAFDYSNFDNGTFNCAWAECQLPFSTQEEWSSHLHQAHVDPQMTFDCPLQSDTCPSNISSHPLDHLQAAHGFDFSYNNYTCPAPTCVADEIFCNPAMLHNHFDQAHATPATGLLFCQWNACNSTFTDQRELLYHLTEDHQLVYPTKEPSVGYGGSQPEVAHYPTAIPDEELLEGENGCSCQWHVGPGICGVICENPKELQDHITEQHLKSLNKSTGYYCQWDNCNRKKFGDKAGFSQRGKLVRHMQTHTILKEEICDFPGCGRQFSAKQALMQHKRLHTGEKPFKCSHCDRAFAQQSACTMHERTHTGIKPLQCEHCGKRFSESSNLSKHRRMHQEEKEKKSYKCDFTGCGKAFVRFASLRNHKKEAHAGMDRGNSIALDTDSEGLITESHKHASLIPASIEVVDEDL